VDSATAASKKGFCPHYLSLQKKTNITQERQKITFFIPFIFNNRAVVKQDH
jgi:hypothetical protein